LIKAIIVDDEQPSLNKLEKQLTGSGLVEVAGKFTEPVKAVELLKRCKVDVAFLDIEMPDINGIELANRFLEMQDSVAVVFVTAYNQYAVEAFRLNALDYLLKPVSTERLMETLQRIMNQFGMRMQHEKLRVQCFGKFRVTAGNDEIRFRTEKAEELLTFLIDQNGAFISRNKIIDSLWEDFDADRAIVHFNTTLHYVKKALLSYGIRISIQYDRGSYRLDVNDLDCDYLDFCSFEESKTHVCHENISAYENAAALYFGEYLSGCDYTWAAGKRLLLEEQFIGLLLAIAEHYKEAKMYPEVLKWLKKGLIHEPLHRELNYRLIEALLITHELIMASKYYDLYRNGILKSLNQEPDAAFKNLLG